MTRATAATTAPGASAQPLMSISIWERSVRTVAESYTVPGRRGTEAARRPPREAGRSVTVRQGSQLRRSLQSFGGIGSHNIRNVALAQLTSHRLGSASTDGRLLYDQAVQLGFVHRYRLGVVQRGEGCAQGAHRYRVAGAHRFRQGSTHTNTQ